MKPEFYLKKPDEEQNSVLDAICDKMDLTRNNKITPNMLNISDDFCGDPSNISDKLKLVTSLRDNVETPSIYALYLFEIFEGSDDEDDDD
jgi:hypothetical protein